MKYNGFSGEFSESLWDSFPAVASRVEGGGAMTRDFVEVLKQVTAAESEYANRVTKAVLACERKAGEWGSAGSGSIAALVVGFVVHLKEVATQHMAISTALTELIPKVARVPRYMEAQAKKMKAMERGARAEKSEARDSLDAAKFAFSGEKKRSERERKTLFRTWMDLNSVSSTAAKEAGRVAHEKALAAAQKASASESLAREALQDAVEGYNSVVQVKYRKAMDKVLMGGLEADITRLSRTAHVLQKAFRLFFVRSAAMHETVGALTELYSNMDVANDIEVFVDQKKSPTPFPRPVFEDLRTNEEIHDVFLSQFEAFFGLSYEAEVRERRLQRALRRRSKMFANSSNQISPASAATRFRSASTAVGGQPSGAGGRGGPTTAASRLAAGSAARSRAASQAVVSSSTTTTATTTGATTRTVVPMGLVDEDEGEVVDEATLSIWGVGPGVEAEVDKKEKDEVDTGVSWELRRGSAAAVMMGRGKGRGGKKRRVVSVMGGGAVESAIHTLKFLDHERKEGAKGEEVDGEDAEDAEEDMSQVVDERMLATMINSGSQSFGDLDRRIGGGGVGAGEGIVSATPSRETSDGDEEEVNSDDLCEEWAAAAAAAAGGEDSDGLGGGKRVSGGSSGTGGGVGMGGGAGSSGGASGSRGSGRERSMSMFELAPAAGEIGQEKVHMRGFLFKRGEVRKGWKKRWCVLSSHDLSYATKIGKEPKGRVFVSAMKSVGVGSDPKAPGPVLELETLTRTYFFYPDTASSSSSGDILFEKWRSSLETLISKSGFGALGREGPVDETLSVGDVEQVVVEGFLDVESSTRYVRLSVGMLNVYKSGPESGTLPKPKVSIPCAHILHMSRARDVSAGFVIQTPSKAHQFVAPDEGVMGEWTDGIERVVRLHHQSAAQSDRV